MQALRVALLLTSVASLGGGTLSPARAQDGQSVVPEIPVEESPFFVLNDEEMNPGRRARRELRGPEFDYPRNRGAEQSAAQMFTSFFTDMFSSVKLVKKRSSSKLSVEPSKFSVDERREVSVTFTVENQTGRLLKLDFPTSQRIEILVRDPAGNIVERWSDDRAFRDEAGVVMINPGERIQYEERISTREMEPGKTYTIEASLANNPEFVKTAQVTPTGKPRNLQPHPELSTRNAAPAPTPTPAPESGEAQTDEPIQG